MMGGREGEGGFTLIELLVAVFLLVVGLTAAIGVFDAAGRLSIVSERRTAMVHRAQRELERVESLPFAQAAMLAAPTTSVNPTNPDYYVAQGPPPTFQYDRNTTTTEQLAIDATNGTIGATPTPWSAGGYSGNVYDFVTWTTDPDCVGGTICPATQDYRRVTVEVTLTGATQPSQPAIVSTAIADPNATPSGAPANSAQNPLTSPTTTCQNSLGATVACTNGLGTGTPNNWFLYDTPAMNFSGGVLSTYNTTRLPILGPHTTPPTIAQLLGGVCLPVSLLDSGCQNPGTMGSTPPPQDPTTPVLPYCYSTDVGCPLATLLPDGSQPSPGQTVGGFSLVNSGTSCSTPNATLWTQTNNTKGVFWVTPALAASTTLTGDGGMTLYMQNSTTGLAASVTLCVGIYVVPGPLLGLISLPPVQLGVVAYASTALPGVPTPVSFNFNFLGTGNTQAVVAGNHIGVRVWLAASSSAGVSLLYDHPQFASALQLNSQ